MLCPKHNDAITLGMFETKLSPNAINYPLWLPEMCLRCFQYCETGEMFKRNKEEFILYATVNVHACINRENMQDK